VTKLRERFGIDHIVWVGDRGNAAWRVSRRSVLKPQGMDWVIPWLAPQVAELAAEHGPFQPSLFGMSAICWNSAASTSPASAWWCVAIHCST